MPVAGKHIRTIEIISGLLLLLSTVSILLSFLLNFDYTLPHASFEDDIDFISDSISRQRISAISWLITGIIFLLYLPFYLSVFYSFQKGMHLLNGLCILLIAYMAVRGGLTQFEIVMLVGKEAAGDPFISIETEKILRSICSPRATGNRSYLPKRTPLQWVWIIRPAIFCCWPTRIVSRRPAGYPGWCCISLPTQDLSSVFHRMNCRR